LQILTLLCIGQAAVADMPEFIQPKYHEVVHAWLDAHPMYRLAVDGDCKCEDDIGSPQPTIHPYFASGDFDGDGLGDIAVVALPNRAGLKILVVVFFGSKSGLDPDASEIPLPYPSVLAAGLFVGKSKGKGRPRHDALGYGAFESEWEDLPIKRRKPSIDQASKTAQPTGH